MVAVVGGETISLDEMVMQVGPERRASLRQGRATADELALVERLVNIKLIVAEATRMGLSEAPEIRKQVEVTSREILREVLVERLLKDVRADPVAVEKLYRESVREWKTVSLLFKDEAAAKKARQEVAGGAPWADVSAKAVSAKLATAERDDRFHPRKDYLPSIAEALAKLQVGQVSDVIRLQSGFVFFKVADLRYPENPKARAEAQQKVLDEKRKAVLVAHDEELRRRYVVVNQAVLKAIDYEAPKPGVEALLKDQRVVAEIKGGPRLTVGELTDYLQMQFYHGTEQAAQRKQMTAKKEMALDATLGRRLLNMEAEKLGINKTNAYRDRVRGFRESLIFESFVQKVIAPENRLQESDIKRYYDAHIKEYSSPEMMKIRGLAFSHRNAAETAMRKLREGADYGWLAANAEGQVDKNAAGLLAFDGRPLMTSTMPDAAQKAVAGSKAGDLRLYQSPEGYFYVLAVQQVIAPNPKPYAEAKDDVGQKASAEKLKKAVEDYARKLRAQSKVEVFLKRVQ